jgi:hypothetical protein
MVLRYISLISHVFWYHRAHLLLIRLHLALRALKMPGSRQGLSVEVAEHF